MSVNTTMYLSKKVINAEGSTFQLLPLTNECPYMYGIFNPGTLTLIMVGRDPHDQGIMTDKLDAFGNPVTKAIPGGTRQNQRAFVKERKYLKQPAESHISEPEEIIEFVKIVAINGDKIREFTKLFMPEVESKQPRGSKKSASK